MEDPPSPERAAAVRCDDDRQSIRDGIGVDGKWYHQRVFGEKYQRGSVGACMLFVHGPHLHLLLMTT